MTSPLLSWLVSVLKGLEGFFLSLYPSQTLRYCPHLSCPIPSSTAQTIFFLHRQHLAISPEIYLPTQTADVLITPTWFTLLIQGWFSLQSQIKTRGSKGPFLQSSFALLLWFGSFTSCLGTFWCIFRRFLSANNLLTFSNIELTFPNYTSRQHKAHRCFREDRSSSTGCILLKRGKSKQGEGGIMGSSSIIFHSDIKYKA